MQIGKTMILAVAIRFIFLIISITIATYLIYVYYKIIPTRYFYIFIIILIIFTGFYSILQKNIAKKFYYLPNISKIIDFLYYIVLGVLMYLFAIYIYPGLK